MESRSNVSYLKISNLEFIYKQLNSAFINFYKYEDEVNYDKFLYIANEIKRLIYDNKLSYDDMSVSGDINIHSVNVAVLCGRIGYSLGFNDKEVLDLIHGGLLHDIGKPFIESRIINKPSVLTLFERITVNKHEDIGKDIVSLFSDNETIIDMVGNHHSYIKKIKEPIQLNEIINRSPYYYTLICSIADITDAIKSKRVYKPSLSIDFARNELYHKGILDIDIIYKYIGIL